jgi:hypothetical protein
MRLLPTALAAFGCALALPAAANAAYHVGQNPDGVLEGSSTLCEQTCTLMQDVLANESMRVPDMSGVQKGVVVRWDVRGRGGQARLRRVGLAGDVGTPLGATGRTNLSGTIQQIPAAMPVQTGDAIALDLTAGAEVDSQETVLGDTIMAWAPALADGAGRASDGVLPRYMAMLAVIEPDADGDGLGDETQDSCVNCGGGTPPPGGGTPPPGGGTPPPPVEEDPYAAIRKAGPSATIAGTATRKGRKVAVTVTNPHAFTIKGKLQLKRGRKVVGKAKLNLAANATKTIKLAVRGRARKLKAAATLRGPVGGARTTTKTVKLTTAKPPKPGKGGVDGTYRGSGAGADWVMEIRKGIVTNFNGSITIYCTKAGKQQNHTFAMIADDPDPSVAADGSFAWEATSGYGFDKLKFDGVVKGGSVTGKMMVESRPLIQGVSPVSGLPRLEAEYCFAGRDYTLTKD